MCRPTATRKALSFAPLVKTRGADASGVERVPQMTALAEPFVFFPWRPAAERTADARGFRLAGLLLLFKLAIQYVGFRCPSHKAEVLLMRLIGLLRVAFA